MSCAALWIAGWGGTGLLNTGSAQVACQTREGYTWLGFATAQPVECETAGWMRDLLGTRPTACAEVGGADDYLVVQLPRDSQLRDISRPDTVLGSYTRRALVVTCSVSEPARQCAEHIHFRYFAPQYGVPEDTATGSAMRVLASYWQRCGLGPQLVALQCSPQGGLLHSHIRDGLTWVGGRVMAEETANA